jgi:hypothetical protein
MAMATLGILAVAASTGAITALNATGLQAEALARYPGNASVGVPRSTEIHVQLQPGFLNDRSDFDIVVLDPEGQEVEGHSDLSDTSVLSFIPDELLEAGQHTVEVHHRDSPPTQENVLDSWAFTVKPASDLIGGAGGSILLVAHEGTSDTYLAEILRAEGIPGFDTVSPADVSPEMLDHHEVVLLGAGSTTGPHVAPINSWVQEGGDLVVMKPGDGLSEVTGLRSTGEILSDAYFQIDTSQAPGAGLTAEPLQFHGDAVVYESEKDVSAVASLAAAGRTDESAPPAVTLTDGNAAGGRVAAFSFDLAQSVINTRQGNPDWAGQERDGSTPIRPNDMFAASGTEPAHLDLEKLGIPQADEQMRLLSNVLVELHGDAFALPRFWYLPHGVNATLVMTADDHGTDGGTQESFQRMLSLQTPGCDADAWECPRATSWLDPSSPLTDADAAEFHRKGFDLGVHASTECLDWTADSLNAELSSDLMSFRSKYPSIPDQHGHRMHCVAYSDWLTMPTVGRKWGIRLDMNYYNWPSDWIQGRAGYMTGSALPMRFAGTEGHILNVFQQESHLVNETWNGSAHAIEALIDAAEDERGYFGAFGTHYDFSDDFDKILMDIATRRDVPMVSAQQLLDFVDGRQASSFKNVVPDEDGDLSFEIDTDARATGLLYAMLPIDAAGHVLRTISLDGEQIEYSVRQVKGTSYAFFPAENGKYRAAFD